MDIVVAALRSSPFVLLHLACVALALLAGVAAVVVALRRSSTWGLVAGAGVLGLGGAWTLAALAFGRTTLVGALSTKGVDPESVATILAASHAKALLPLTTMGPPLYFAAGLLAVSAILAARNARGSFGASLLATVLMVSATGSLIGTEVGTVAWRSHHQASALRRGTPRLTDRSHVYMAARATVTR